MIIRIKLKIVLTNVSRHAHWAVQAKYNKMVKERVAATWKSEGYQGTQLEIFPTQCLVQHLHAGKVPDTGNCFNTAKAAVDGLVKQGLMPDDNPKYLGCLLFLPPVKVPKAEEGMVLGFFRNIENGACAIEEFVDSEGLRG